MRNGAESFQPHTFVRKKVFSRVSGHVRALPVYRFSHALKSTGLTAKFLIVPERPRKMNAAVKNATTIDVEWLPPNQKGQNGIIRGYLIYIQPVDERDELIGDTYKYNIMDGSATQYTITNLKPDTNYNVQVEVCLSL